ncbi:glycosyltransferase 87 family protein [Janibacter sp. G56]|uniref:glycosyltransferase 87 family protein n=1 Tax=Janibacter sp. G56 TaxID=3418717 RepID=UPI003CFCCEB4
MSRPDLLPPRESAFLGGPVGRYAASATFARLVPLIVAMTAVPVIAAVLRQGHCLAKGWNGDEQFWRGCFSDLPAQYQLGGLSGGVGALLSGDAHLDQPPLSALVMAALGGLVPDGTVLDQTRWYLLFWAVLATILLMVTTWCTAALRPRRLDLATQLALSPIIFGVALLSPDVVAVAAVALAMWAWSRDHWLLAGLLLGAGVLSRTYVIAVVVALLLWAVRAGRLRDALASFGVAVITASTTTLALLLVNRDLVTAAWAAWRDSAPGYGSPWMVPQLLEQPLPGPIVTLLPLVGWVVAVLLGAAFVRLSPWQPTWAQVAVVVAGVVIVTGKAVPVQAALWLLPLVIVSGLAWREHLAWAVVELLHLGAVWLYIGAQTVPDRGLPAGWYGTALLARLAMVWFVIWRAASTPGPEARPAPPAPPVEDTDDYRAVVAAG